MQKRLLALVATVAMVLSMFAGIAFAAAPATVDFSGLDAQNWVKRAANGAITGTIKGVAKDSDGSAPDVTSVDLATVDTDGTPKDVLHSADTVVTTGVLSIPVDGSKTITSTDKLALFVGDVKIADIDVATADPKVVLTSGTSFISTGGDIGTYNLQGEIRLGNKVLSQYTGATVTVSVSNGSTIKAAIPVVNGRFNYLLSTNLPVSNLVVGTDITGVTSARLDVVYVTSVSPELNFNYSANPLFAIIGSLKDAKGNAIKGTDTVFAPHDTEDRIQLHYIDADTKRPVAGGLIAKTNTITESGQFSLTVDNWAKGAGSIGLFYYRNEHASDAVLLKSGKVVASTDAKLTATPNSGIVHTLTDTDVKLAVTGVPSGSTVTVDVKYGTTTVDTVSLAWDADSASYKATYTSDFSAKGAGTYTFEAEAVKDGKATHTASTTVSVVNASPGYMLLDKTGKLSKLPSVGVTANIVFGGADVEAVKVKADGTADSTAVFRYTVFVDGDKEIDQKGTATLALKGSKLGSIPVRVQVELQDATDLTKWTRVMDKTYNVEIPGWKVDVDVTSLAINEAQDITFVVTDKDGNPINNARVLIDGVVVVSSATTNINNGTYVAKNVKYATPGTRTVKVQTLAGIDKAVLSLNVLGDKVYETTANKTELLLGLTEKVRISVVENGKLIIPFNVEMQQGSTITTLAYTAVDTDNDGAVDAVEVSVTPANLRNAVLRATNSDKTRIGEVTLTVAQPKLVADVEYITENVKSAVTFKVVDPRDDSVLEKNITLVDRNFELSKVYAEDNKTEVVWSSGLLGAAEHKFSFLPVAADYDEAADLEEEVELTFTIKLNNEVDVDGGLVVKPAEIVSNPPQITVGQATNLVLTYQDANGNPIVGKEVFVGADKTGLSLGKTNAEGQVSYAATQATTVAFAAYTDVSGEYTKLTVQSVVDTVGPEVTAPETSNKSTAIITIKDNVRVIRLFVNGEEITNIIPRQELKHVVNLKRGKNVFEIIAIDSNYNVTEETVEINFVDDSVVLKGEQVKRQGEFVFVQVRQFEELGAQVGWKQDTQTATFIVGDTKVEVTIGSMTAKVNGKAVTMPAAPFIDKATSRTYVPTRFIAEALNWNVHWAQGDIITITLP